MSPDREITPEELRELGLFDPSAEDASERLELLQYLHSLGPTRDDLIAYRDELPGLASVLAIRGGVALTLEEAAQRSGLPVENVRGINRVAGFPDPGPDDRVFGERFVGLASGMTAAEALIGMPLLGIAKRRLADQLGSAATKGEGNQNLLCAYLAGAVLFGLAGNALFGLWWLDPIAALFIAGVAVREGRETWRGEGCCAGPELTPSGAHCTDDCCD